LFATCGNGLKFGPLTPERLNAYKITDYVDYVTIKVRVNIGQFPLRLNSAANQLTASNEHDDNRNNEHDTRWHVYAEHNSADNWQLNN
jgi:hypothetical protein